MLTAAAPVMRLAPVGYRDEVAVPAFCGLPPRPGGCRPRPGAAAASAGPAPAGGASFPAARPGRRPPIRARSRRGSRRRSRRWPRCRECDHDRGAVRSVLQELNELGHADDAENQRQPHVVINRPGLQMPEQDKDQNGRAYQKIYNDMCRHEVTLAR